MEFEDSLMIAAEKTSGKKADFSSGELLKKYARTPIVISESRIISVLRGPEFVSEFGCYNILLYLV